MSETTLTKAEQYIDIAVQQLLAPSALEIRHLDSVLSDLHAQGPDDAEIYLQYKRSESWALDDGIVRDGSYSISQGAGLRVVADDKSGFAYADDVSIASLQRSAAIAKSILLHGGSTSQILRNYRRRPLHQFNARSIIPAWIRSSVFPIRTKWLCYKRSMPWHDKKIRGLNR